MKIFGIGNDIIYIKRVTSIIKKNQQYRLAKKILHINEFKEFQQTKYQNCFLAKKIVAKEAFLKALGTGFNKKIYFSQIEIKHTKLGKPYIKLYKSAHKLCKKFNVNKIHITISDEKSYAISTVILETKYS